MNNIFDHHSVNASNTIGLDDLVAITEALRERSTCDLSMYQYYKGLDRRRILINDDVSDYLVEKAIIPLMDMDNDGSGEPIEIILNTNGGDVYTGMMLCRVIESLKTPTTIRILSMAASMGSLISMAGHNNPNVNTVCYKYTVFLIHAGSYYFEGSANQVKDTFKFQEKYEDILGKYITTHSSITEDEYEQRTRYEWWLTADEAKKYGIVNEVL